MLFRKQRAKSSKEHWQLGEKLLRQGKTKDAEHALLEAAKSISPLDKHYAYVKLISLYQHMLTQGYPKTDDLKRICLQDIELFPDFYEAWMLEYQNSIPSPYFPSFSVLADIYEQEGQLSLATQLCELAIGYQLHETVGPDYPQRLVKLQKK